MHRSQQTEMALELNIEEARHLVDSFFQNLTQEQLEFFRLDQANDATKAILTEFLLDLILLLAKCVLKTLNNATLAVSEKDVMSTLGDTFPQTLSRALNLTKGLHSASTASLTSLINSEVAKSVNSALSARSESPEPVIDVKDTSPESLNDMVQHTSKIIQDYAGKIQTQYTSPPSRHRSSISPMSDSSVEDVKDASKTPDKSFSMESPDEGSVESTEDSLLATTSKAVEDVLRKEVSDIMEPLLSDMSDEDFKQLESGSLCEIRTVSEDIAEVIVDHVKSTQTHVSEKDKESTKVKFSKLGTKIKNFFTNQFARASVFRIMGQLKDKFFDNSKVKSSQSMEELMTSVDSVLHLKDKKGEVAVYKSSWIKKISRGNVQLFIENLTSLLGSYTDGLTIIPEPDETSRGETVLLVTPQPATISSVIRERVQCFVGLMKWWQTIQAELLRERITKLAVKETSAAVSVSSQTLAKLEKEARAKEQIKKMSVMVIVQRLVTRILKETNVHPSLVDPQHITDRLFDCIWAEVQSEDFEVSEEALECLDKKILKDLCKSWSCAPKMMVAIYLEDPLIERNIAFLFKQHLINGSKKGNIISRFFSRLCQIKK